MRAVMPTLLPDVADMRKRNGSDRWDEMWEGELHTPPAPNRDHQRFQFKLVEYLEYHWAQPAEGAVSHDRNVATTAADWTANYRVPDLVLLTRERLTLDKNEYVLGGPDVAVEIHSSGDEAYHKLAFYAQIGVREVWIIDRDSKEPEIYALIDAELVQQSAKADGWHQSAVTGLEMRPDGKGKLRIRRSGEHATEKSLPDRQGEDHESGRR